MCFCLTAHNSDSAEHHNRHRRQAWLPRIGRRTTLVLPRTGRPEGDVLPDSFEVTLRRALEDYATEQAAMEDDCGMIIIKTLLVKKFSLFLFLLNR